MSEHTWASSHVVVTHCPHGLDLRIYPVCYLCNPRETFVAEAIAAERARIRAAVEGLLEHLSALEHNQWMAWSQTIAQQGLTPERIARWETTWVPYAELDEPTKEYDREWARPVVAAVLDAIDGDEA